MKLLSSHFTAPVVFVVLSCVAGCSSDNASGGSGGGTSAGGHPGSGGGVSVGGTSAGGSAPAAGGVGTGGSATGTGGSAAGTGGGASTGASYAAVQAIILKSCFGAICHDLAENPLKLKPVETMYSTLKTHVTKNCGPLVNTASPADSALVKILKGSCGTAPNTTDRMPYQTCFDGDTFEDNPACIPNADIDTIQAWITSGAPM